MNKITLPTQFRKSETEPFREEAEVPMSLDWTAEATNMPGSVGRAIFREGEHLEPFLGIKDSGLARVMDGLGEVVAVCPSREVATFITEAGNHFAECRDALVEARAVLLQVLRGKSSIQDVVDMVNELETTIAAAGGSY